MESGSHLTVSIAGGTPIDAKQWLGDEHVDCREQAPGDLGDRLKDAIEEAFANGAGRVLVIGTDCPSIDAAIYEKAIAILAENDLVLGPALDGGYYLIGMNRLVHSLFQNIPWGTETVMEATQEAARAASLSVGLCPPLPDVDLPEDLQAAEKALALGSSLSVIIPVLNEAKRIANLIRILSRHNPSEIIVVDGGSADATVVEASKAGATVIFSSRGRAAQMNAGAALATGENLLFLHADTTPPENFPKLIADTLNRPGTSAGAFRFELVGDFGAAPLIEYLVNLRCRCFQTPYGDQGIFMRRSAYRFLGGFTNLPVGEDLDLTHRLRKMGKIRATKASAPTSARRWQNQGMIRTFLYHQSVILAYHLRLPASWIARIRS
jgi:hypothetical protein